MELTLLKIGTNVRIKSGGLEGYVSEIWIKGTPDALDVLYQVTWWSNREIKNHYFRPYEIEAHATPSVNIGFK
jgi:uncharacterized protein YodC (DUF2158 family)